MFSYTHPACPGHPHGFTVDSGLTDADAALASIRLHMENMNRYRVVPVELPDNVGQLVHHRPLRSMHWAWADTAAVAAVRFWGAALFRLQRGDVAGARRMVGKASGRERAMRSEIRKARTRDQESGFRQQVAA